MGTGVLQNLSERYVRDEPLLIRDTTKAELAYIAARAEEAELAKEAGNVWLIGCDVDQYDDGARGDGNAMLTSCLKVMDVNVQRQLEAIYDGTFAGQDAFLAADTDSTGYVSAEGRQQLSADTLEKLAECYEQVKSGAIVPAANFNGHTPDNFPGL